jgi:CheY-like chemotaxis protein
MPRILIVDDDAHMRDVLELVLAAKDQHVDGVDSGRAALERLAQHTYDLVVCDLHMSDLDGAAVYRTIEQQPPPRPAVLFVTGAADVGRYKAFLRTTRAPVVGKPFDIDALRETVRRLLGGT